MGLKVLLTCVGGGLSSQAVRFLKESKIHKNIKVYGVDMNPHAPGKYFVDYFQKVSNGKSKKFTSQIKKICKKFNIDLIIPGSDEDALNLSKNKKAISVDRIRTMYHYMTVKKGVAYGHKGLSTADPEKLYTFEELSVYHGLMVPSHRIWHHALDRMPAHEVTYIVSLLRRKEKLNQEPRINLSTIHGAKGGEADNVALLADLPRKADEAYYKDPDNERRVFYVGMTRTKKNLHLVRSDTDREFKEMFYG